MSSKIVIALLICIIAFQTYSNAYAGRQDDVVGEIDCRITDAVMDGLKIRRIDARGFLTEIE